MTTFLVNLATGQQSRYTIKYLLAGGSNIHAIVRNSSSEGARQLEEEGAGKVKLFQGNLDDLDVYSRAAAGTSGLFLNLPDPSPSDDVDAQYRIAKAILQSVQKAGLNRVVASSTMFADQPDKWDNEANGQTGLRRYFHLKSRMEDAVRESGMDWTILRPSWLLGNYLTPTSPFVYPELKSKGELAHALKSGRTMVHVDEEDVGKYAAAALQNPKKFLEKEVDLGNEDLSMDDVAVILGKISGTQVTTRIRSPDEVQALLKGSQSPASLAFELFANDQEFKMQGQSAQVEFGISLTSLEDYLAKQRSRLRGSLPPQRTQ